MNHGKNEYADPSQCLRCTHCCQVIVNIYPFSAEMAEWIAARGFKMIDSSEAYIAVEIPCPCPNLVDNKCLLQDIKPESCKKYPRFITQTELSKLGLKRERVIGKKCGYAKTAKT